MKFFQPGDKHRDNDYLDEEYSTEEITPPRYMPSYYNIAKKESKKNKNK